MPLACEVALHRQDEPPRRPDAGKVLGLVTVDAPEGDRGKPCGQSHIPKGSKCHKNGAVLSNNTLRTAATVALTAGVIAGGVAIARKWNAKDQQQLDEALKGGKTWDVYDRKLKEDATDPEVALLRQQREAQERKYCGLNEGKTKAGRSDAFQPCSRQIGDVSAFGKIYLHSSGKVCFKVPTGNQNISQQRAILAADNEYIHLGLAQKAGVTVPKLISMNHNNIIKMEYISDAVTLRDFLKNGDRSRFRNISDDLFKSLHKMHQAGIAHRDMHSGNILVTPDNRAHIIDFGLARSGHINGLSEPFTRASLTSDMHRSILLMNALNDFSFQNGDEIETWVRSKNPVVWKLDSQKNSTLDDKSLRNIVDSFYADLHRAITFKRQQPKSRLLPGMNV